MKKRSARTCTCNLPSECGLGVGFSQLYRPLGLLFFWCIMHLPGFIRSIETVRLQTQMPLPKSEKPAEILSVKFSWGSKPLRPHDQN